jgi:periplasmic protein TonB
MPSEFLRDVLRPDDAAGRSRRRWLLFPASVAVHVVGAAAYLIVPLAAEVTMPTPASPFVNRRWVMPVTPPTAALPSPQRTPTPSAAAAPTDAPPKIVPEVPVVAELPPPGALEGPPGVSVGVPDGSAIAGPVVPPPPPIDQPADRKPLKIGGAIRAPNRIAATPPVYPPFAITARIEGEVVLEALIDEQGRVTGVRVLKSVPLLDAAAVDAVRTWRYTPTLLNGVPVSVLMTVKVTFSLQR